MNGLMSGMRLTQAITNSRVTSLQVWECHAISSGREELARRPARGRAQSTRHGEQCIVDLLFYLLLPSEPLPAS